MAVAIHPPVRFSRIIDAQRNLRMAENAIVGAGLHGPGADGLNAALESLDGMFRLLFAAEHAIRAAAAAKP